MSSYAEKQRCRVCGCTDERACDGGCWWVKWNLCSGCAEPTPTGWRARSIKVFEVYLCATPMARHPGKFHTSHKAVPLDSRWEPIGPIPFNAEKSLGRFPARSKGDAIRDAIAQAKGGHR